MVQNDWTEKIYHQSSILLKVRSGGTTFHENYDWSASHYSTENPANHTCTGSIVWKYDFYLVESGRGNAAADAFPYGWSSWIWINSQFMIRVICVWSFTSKITMSATVFSTYWTRRNRRHELLVPGLELVNFNDWFLDFNGFLFNWNGDFFLCKSNERDTIKE